MGPVLDPTKSRGLHGRFYPPAGDGPVTRGVQKIRVTPSGTLKPDNEAKQIPVDLRPHLSVPCTQRDTPKIPQKIPWLSIEQKRNLQHGMWAAGVGGCLGVASYPLLPLLPFCATLVLPGLTGLAGCAIIGASIFFVAQKIRQNPSNFLLAPLGIGVGIALASVLGVVAPSVIAVAAAVGATIGVAIFDSATQRAAGAAAEASWEGVKVVGVRVQDAANAARRKIGNLAYNTVWFSGVFVLGCTVGTLATTLGGWPLLLARIY